MTENTVQKTTAVGSEVRAYLNSAVGRKAVERQKAFEQTFEHKLLRTIRWAFAERADFWLEILYVNGMPKAEWSKLADFPEGKLQVLFKAHPRITTICYLDEENCPDVSREDRQAVNHTLTREISISDIAQRKAEGHDGWPLLLESKVVMTQKGPCVGRCRLARCVRTIGERLGVKPKVVMKMMELHACKKPEK